MSIFSKAKSAFKKYVSNVVGGAKIVGSAISNTAKKVTSKSQSSAVLNFSDVTSKTLQKALQPKSVEQARYTVPGDSKTYTKTGLASIGLSPTSSNVGGGVKAYEVSNSTPANRESDYNIINNPNQYLAPRTIYSGSSGSKTSSVDNTFYAPTPTSTITAGTLGGGAGAVGLSGTSSPVTLPSTPSNRDMGAVNLQGLSTPDTKINTETGLFDTQGDLQQQEGNDLNKAIEKLREENKIPEKESVFENKDIQQQQEEVKKQQQEVNNWQGQLNSIVAKQQQDLMRHEKEISLAGGTVEGFSGRAAAINREAAYAALPIQAQLATSQGNLELAQSYLKDLTTMVQEEIDNNYTYKVAQYNAVKEIADKKEKTILDNLEKEETRTYNERNDNLSLIDSWMQEAVSTQQPNLVGQLSKLNIDDPNFRQKLAGVIGQIREPAKASSSGSESGLANDITIAIQEFQRYMKENNQRGIDPTVYDFYRSQILTQYKTAGTSKLDAAIKSAGMAVDYGGSSIDSTGTALQSNLDFNNL